MDNRLALHCHINHPLDGSPDNVPSEQLRITCQPNIPKLSQCDVWANVFSECYDQAEKYVPEVQANVTCHKQN